MAVLKELANWAAWLRPEDIPDRVRALAASQVLSQIASIRAGSVHTLGRRLTEAFGPPLQHDARLSACVLAGLGSFLNLDDTAYAGHLSNSTVAVPLAYAYDRRLGGADLLTAVVAANECAARITAAATLGPLRGHSAVHTHLAGAVSGRLHCEGADDAVWTSALGLAFAMPNWPLMRAFLASDARIFNTFTPVRTAMDACDGARVGLRGAVDIIEHPDGFLDRFSAVPLPDAVNAGLGERWHTETLSFKLHPGGPGVDAAVDCAAELRKELGPLHPDEIAEVVVEASLYTLFAGRKAAAYVTGPDSPLGALVLHTPYPVATALLNGELTVDDFTAPMINDRGRWQVADRVRLVHDPELTRALFASEAPFGEALRQAGDAAEPWLREFAGEHEAKLAVDAANSRVLGDFSASTKATGARVTVRLTDGRTVTRERLVPLAAAGPHTRAHHAELMREKFLEFGGSLAVADAAGELDGMSADDLQKWISAALG
ncbi:2-methylcitrate dehydratase PrpD [Kitasatospora sp. MAP12-15]|uniref:MmgE/PrpD family protein n=1 Tax=unclassified Kitasatospora TaxID=2633591 RepID=UPI002475CC10|nr:MmgE/PrpD family protein [Kitasatospora sp. MAP12-44]MDH6110609.1 2-methylcitrate dehydratase PrpD [Kitasatospora sp. MAP12-44]